MKRLTQGGESQGKYRRAGAGSGRERVAVIQNLPTSYVPGRAQYGTVTGTGSRAMVTYRQGPYPRPGYGSVARARGAAVTGEMKYFDADRSAVAITATTGTWPAGTIMDPGTTINLGSAAVANPLCLFCPTVGAALNQRIGRKVRVMKVKIHWTINVPQQAVAANADGAAKVRMFLVLDMQTNAAQMTSALLLQDATNADTTINTFQNPNNFGRFRVLKEKVVNIGNASMTGAAAAIEQSGMIYSGKMTVNLNGLVVDFNATNGGTVADIIDNSLHIIIGANFVSLAPTFAYYVRTCFKE